MELKRSPAPVLAVCGFSGSGKTTLLEAVISRMVDRGIDVAVVKHDAHGITIDHPGKDSDRLFRAGADVALRSPEELVLRWHGRSAPDLPAVLRLLAAGCDMVLVEGHKSTSLPKIWLLAEGASQPPREVEGILEVLPWNGPRVEMAERIVLELLESAWRQRPVVGGVLIGGASRRMGQPKQLLERGGRSLVEGVVDVLRCVVDDVVLLGEGELPEAIKGMPRVADPPGLGGPIAGLLGALRWCPEAAWVVMSCDLPFATDDGVRWLLGQRGVGRWAVLPRSDDGRLEPLFATYEPQSRMLLERLVSEGRMAPRRIADHSKVANPSLPGAIVDQWISINTPEEYQALSRTTRRQSGTLTDGIGEAHEA